MATLTTYTQALQHIDTQTFGDTLKRIVYTPGNGYAADTYTLELTCAPNQKLFNGYLYALTVDGNPNAIYAKLSHADIADSDRCSLRFVRLHVEAEEIAKAVLAEHEAAATAPIIGASIPFTVTWDRSSPFPVWTFGESPSWRKGTGNNP